MLKQWNVELSHVWPNQCHDPWPGAVLSWVTYQQLVTSRLEYVTLLMMIYSGIMWILILITGSVTAGSVNQDKENMIINSLILSHDHRVLARQGLCLGSCGQESFRLWSRSGWPQHCVLLQTRGGMLHQEPEASLLCRHALRHDGAGPDHSLGSSSKYEQSDHIKLSSSSIMLHQPQNHTKTCFRWKIMILK